MCTRGRATQVWPGVTLGHYASTEKIATRPRKLSTADERLVPSKATLLHGPTHITDYFVLLNLNGEWKIANKVYDAARGR